MKAKIIALSTLILGLQSFASTGADNTKMNARDGNSGQVTAGEQSQSSSDIDMTSRIRQDIMKGEELSTYAQNVKIITVNGKVTLKGPVRSATEQARIMEYARDVAGATNVKNEMSIVTE